MKRRFWFLFLIFVTPFVAITAALALLADSNLYFTDNTAASGSVSTPTEMDTALVSLIDSAALSIDLAIYDFNRVNVRDALIAAQNRGVLVRVVTDDEAYHNSSYVPHFSAMEAAGIIIVNDDRSPIMHNKFFVIDGSVVWSGSTNISDNGFTYNHNNSVVYTNTALANIYSQEFEQMYVGGIFGTGKADTVTTTVMHQGMTLEIYFSPQDDALDEMLAEVNSATDEILFSIFFFTSDPLRDALIERSQNGVTIRGIWDNLGASNGFSDDEALCAAGIPIRIEDFGGKMHNKFMVIDPQGADPRVVTGSMNWTNAGDRSNDENTLIVHDAPTAQSFAGAFNDLWDALDPQTQCETGGSVSIFLPAIFRPFTGVITPADIRIALIEYNPPGSDVEGEFIVLQNYGDEAQDLTDWQISDEASALFTFPSYTILGREQVVVWTGSGTNNGNNLFWGSGSAIWNNGGDTATLANHNGLIIDFCSYDGGGQTATCE